MSVKEHYNNHLGNFYSWMTGDFSSRKNEFKKFLSDNSIAPASNKIAIDLGAGHGIQSVALAEQGFKVIAVDFSQQLLSELNSNSSGKDITILDDDIRNIKQFAEKPGLIICCGDTLSHLGSKHEVSNLISDIAEILDNNGKLILSFRDYSKYLTGTDRIIPVKSANNKILTCILDFEEDYLTVTDLLYEKINKAWEQKVSMYKKVRLQPPEVISYLTSSGFTVTFNQVLNGIVTIIGSKS